ncbi:MAG: hypothetical protein A2Y24_00420 [Clostridiales bacterium GWE2_32_10]|nr:MAG: hypothetical protein A2Y24_00420 [Clostridiales bacterium GWE2_32_10]HBY21393.1 DNA polymerase subunit beta [Clostridiales bacterium]
MKEITPEIQQMLEELKEEVLKIAGSDVKKIILFGSYARGDYEEESDIDVMILVGSDNSKKYDNEIVDTQTDLCIKYGKVVMPLFYSYQYYKEKENSMPLYINVKNEGVTVYDAA